MKTILVVDDERKVREMLRMYLAQEGYRVVEAKNGRDALFVARYEKPDLILLDIMMPEMSGTEFLRLHRKEAKTPVIMLTAKVEEMDEVLGLELGADDYITKPFSIRPMLARVAATLRRAGNAWEHSPEILRAGDLTLDLASRLATANGNAVTLTRFEFDLLHAFMQSPNRTFSRYDLLKQVTDNVEGVNDRTIDVHIRNLRAKIEPSSDTPRYIQTVYGMGYRFVAS